MHKCRKKPSSLSDGQAFSELWGELLKQPMIVDRAEFLFHGALVTTHDEVGRPLAGPVHIGPVLQPFTAGVERVVTLEPLLVVTWTR